MEHISKTKAQKFENGAVTAWEYEAPDASLNLAPISIRGRYPETGFTHNTVSDAIVHIVSGSGVLVSNTGAVYELAKDDQIHIAIGDEYYFDGSLDIMYAASPKWTPEQTGHSELA